MVDSGGKKKPGYMFSGAEEPHGVLSKERQEEILAIKARQRIVKLLVGFIGGLAILLIAISAYKVITSYKPESKIPAIPAESGNEPVEKDITKTNSTAERLSDVEPLGSVEVPPEDVPVEDLSIAQLRGVFTEESSGAARLFGALREIEARKPADMIAISNLAFQNESYLLRRQVIKLLSRTTDSGAAALLMKALSDPDPGVRGDAAKALGSLGNRAALGYVYARIKVEPDNEVKKMLIKAIERINGYPLSAAELEELQ